MASKLPVLFHLGLLDIDATLVTNQLRSDLQDDWFPDPLAYADVLDANYLSARVEELQTSSGGLYRSRHRTERNVPKANGAQRYTLEIDLVDRFVYHALVLEIAPTLDTLLGGSVFGQRVERVENRFRKRLLKAPVGAWELFGDAVRENSTDKWIVATDLQNYYETIRLDRLRQVLEDGILNAAHPQAARMAYAADTLLRLLPNWCYAPSHGLPQNRDASAFLANQVMVPIDSSMQSSEWQYFRYMDDIRIKCSSRHDARRALVKLIGELRKHGLTINSKKTELCGPGTEEHKRIIESPNAKASAINNMWKSRSRALVGRSIPHLSDLAASLLADNKGDDRLFRFCIKRFELLSQCREVTVPPEAVKKLKAAVLDRLAADADVCDSLCRFLRAIPLTKRDLGHIRRMLLDREAYLDEWQRYHFTLLLLAKGGVSRALVAESRLCAKKRRTTIPHELSLIVLGRFGSAADKRSIARRFKRIAADSTSSARSALIAVHELDYDRDLAVHLKDHVPLPLMQVLTRLRTPQHRGKYFADPPIKPAAELFDAISDYV